MPKSFRLPDVGEGITEGEIVKWLVKEGDSVKQDQPLVQVETDKAVVDLPSPYTGIIMELHGKEGDIIKVGNVLVTIAEPDEAQKAGAVSEKKDYGSVVGRVEEAPEEKEEILVVPAVRSLAKELGVDLTKIKGTGPGGRITRQDVEKSASSALGGGAAGLPAGQAGMTVAEKGSQRTTDSYGAVEEVPVRGLRRTTAKHLSEAARMMVPVTYTDEADVTALEEIKKKEKLMAQERGVKLTYLPFVIKALIAGLRSHPYLNATLDTVRDVIILKKYYNIGIAVDTPDGLMVFVIKEADKKSILDLAKALNELTPKAQDRTISLADLKGGTFTITNYGVIRGLHGTPMINYPEVAILGTGRISGRPVVVDGGIVVRRILPLSLTFDHRVVDGAEAARFMDVVIRHLEDPNLLLLECR
jgi:pyruvate dehydrogenase E2 component (dihydrolipoamide acetyltransferase)